MFSSLRSRLWLSYAMMIVTALTVVAAVLLAYLIRNPNLYRQTLDRLRAAEGVIQGRPGQLAGALDNNSLQNVAGTFNVRVLIFGGDRSLLQDTDPSAARLPFPQPLLLPRIVPEVRDAKGKFWLYTISALPNGNSLVVAAPRPRAPVLAVFADELLIPLSEGALIALSLSLLLAFIVSRWVADPMQQVVEAARGFPSEEIRPVSPRGPHEVQELTRTFNEMISRVKSSQQSQRDFVANVSHELKTPLTSIQGFAQAILDGTADTPEERRQAAEVIYTEAGRMHRMVLNLLDLARLEAGTADLKMAPLNVRALLNAIAEKFAPLAQKAGVTLRLDMPPGLPALVGDGDRLAQVFTNLVDNALKFTPSGGQVTLRAASRANAGGEMVFEVQDTGPGIPPEALSRIFDRFYQVDLSRSGGKKHGAGLGLSIVQEIVQAHGGRISVRSQLGQGTTFVLNLPLSQSSATTVIRRKR